MTCCVNDRREVHLIQHKLFTFFNLAFLTLAMLITIQSGFGQVAELTDTVHQLKEVVVTYQADRLTPFTYQNLKGAELKLKSTGQEPSFLLSETPSVTVYSDAGSTQGYSYFRMRGIDQTRINV